MQGCIPAWPFSFGNKTMKEQATFEIYPTEMDYAPEILKVAKKYQVRPVVVDHASDVIRLANEIGHPDKLKNIAIVIDILKIAFLGARMAQKDAEDAAGLSEGSLTRYFADKSNAACQRLKEAWASVRSAGKVFLQQMAFAGAMQDRSGKMALDILKAQYPEEFGKQIIEKSEKKETIVTIQDVQVLLVEINRNAEQLKRFGLPTGSLALPATPLSIDQGTGRIDEGESSSCLQAVGEAGAFS